MTDINLLFEFTHDEALTQVAQTLQDRLSQMEMVEEVEAVPEGSEQMRLSGLEIAAAIGVTVLVVRSSRELVAEVRKFVTEVKGLMADLCDLKNVYVDLGAQRIPIDQLDAEQFHQLAQEP
jgi:hypothetical protein